jgi:hypothetical protein
MNFVGIHLSGANSQKTTVVLAEGGARFGPLIIKQVYEKIGSFGSVFSDDRVIEVLSHFPKYSHIFLDCPLTLPPCAACTRPECPGVKGCNDLSVAYMLSLGQGMKEDFPGRRKRPLNPQSQRLWDMVQSARNPKERLEPSFHANIFPLVVRAKAFERRVKAANPSVKVLETSVGHVLKAIAPVLGLYPRDLGQKYRQFGTGRKTREEILAAMTKRGWILDDSNHQGNEQSLITESVENFHAMICAWISVLHARGQTQERPKNFVDHEGWVFLPELTLLR